MYDFVCLFSLYVGGHLRMCTSVCIHVQSVCKCICIFKCANDISLNPLSSLRLPSLPYTPIIAYTSLIHMLTLYSAAAHTLLS